MGNNGILGNTLVAEVIDRLASKLPPGWRVRKSSAAKAGPGMMPSVDVVLEIRGPGKNAGLVLVEAKRRLEPRDVDYMASTLRPTPEAALLVVAPFISPRTQERLKNRGFAYADLTGNLRLTLTEPGLFIDTTGAIQNPEPAARERKSLKGAKAGRLVRALCDYQPPIGLRELAKRAGVDAGYTSRIIDFLNREALVTRTQRGPITDVDWQALLRRWSEEYSPFQRPRATWYLAARGLAQLIEKLKAVRTRYAVSGSWAAAQFAPVAPPRLLLCYTDSAAAIARDLELRPSDTGANVALVTPFDPVVYERTSQKKGITIVALSQVAVDLLTSPGRGPNEGDALMEWMRDNQHVWRT